MFPLCRTRLMPAQVVALVVAITVANSSHSAPAAANRTDNAVIHVERSGHGRPLVFVPGLSCAGEVYSGAVAHFAATHECHVVTLGGFAGQPRFDGPYLDTVRDSLLAYVVARRLDHPVIVGHSLGGVVALEMAITRPDLLGGVVVLDALPFLGGAGDPAATEASAATGMARFRDMIKAQTREQYEAFERHSPYIAAMVTAPADRERVTEWGVRSDPAAVADAMYEVGTRDLRGALERAHVPMLVLGTWYGMKEMTTAARVDSLYRAQYARAPRFEFALADTARHFLMLDDPAWTWGKVDAFLASARTGGAQEKRR